MSTSERPGGTTSGPGPKGAMLLAAAMVLGLVLLNRFDSEPVPFSEEVRTDAETTTTRRSAAVPAATTTTAPPARPPDQVKVLPANGTSTSGLGGRTGDFLRRSGYNALAASDTTRNLDTTIVQYKPDFEPEARAIAQLLQLPLSSLRQLDDSAPVPDTRDADVLVLIGADLRLPDDTATTAGATTTTTRA